MAAESVLLNSELSLEGMANCIREALYLPSEDVLGANSKEVRCKSWRGLLPVQNNWFGNTVDVERR